ncbi:unnamed protein product [Trichogramma brassicae]|uniref:Uncharacterized protein n=1 Tax=Trichogramma brassicae TaxID=86971 RepID=A0A6H5HRM6_9HYME|nr:unnamed protein product [Trichogramma brassicae]
MAARDRAATTKTTTARMPTTRTRCGRTTAWSSTSSAATTAGTRARRRSESRTCARPSRPRRTSSRPRAKLAIFCFTSRERDTARHSSESSGRCCSTKQYAYTSVVHDAHAMKTINSTSPRSNELVYFFTCAQMSNNVHAVQTQRSSGVGRRSRRATMPSSVRKGNRCESMRPTFEKIQVAQPAVSQVQYGALAVEINMCIF